MKDILKFHNNITENHRYKSWEHCRSYFNKNKDNIDLDLAQLHLAFYLASWGMYRGSSFLLQKDYTIFKPIVQEILLDKYKPLWNLEGNNLDKLFYDLYKNIEAKLIKIKESLKEHKDYDKKISKNISSILITKIILGTIGCIPAYDRFFVQGLKDIQKKFNPKKSFNELMEFYQSHKKEFDDLKKKMPKYTIMKLIDMYFWQKGKNKVKK